MKVILYVLGVLAVVFVGCSDQTTPVGPTSGGQFLGKSVQVQRFDVDQIVVEPASGEEYHIMGYIDYIFRSYGSDFKFQRNVELSADSPNKGMSAAVSGYQESKGEIKEGDPTIVTDDFSLNDLAAGHVLHVSFVVTDVVALGDMTIDAKEIIASDK